jgi:outer membrane protein assembly factor BamB
LTKLSQEPFTTNLLTIQVSKNVMNRWQKNMSILLMPILTLSIITSLSPVAMAAQLNPTYAGTKNNGDQLEIKFSQHNNTVVYLADQNSINFSIGHDKYNFDYMSLGFFIYSVFYKASWLSGPVNVYNWSYNDPANMKDDDPNPKMGLQGTISITDAPFGNQQLTVRALAGCYTTDFSSYWIYTADTSETLNLTITRNPPQTPSPTFNYDSGIKWRTDIAWNLTGTPAQNVWESNIGGKGRDWTIPVVANGVLYAGATSSVSLNQYGSPEINWINIYAFNAQSGTQIWDYQSLFSSTTALAVADGRVYFGAQADFYYVEGNVNATEGVNALDAATGKLLWSTPCPIFYSTLITDNGKVFINSGDSVLALDGATGRILWNYTTNAIIVSAPTVTDGVLCVSSNDNTLYALNSVDGNKLWSIKTDNGFSSCVAVNGVVYVDSGDGKLNAYAVSTGNNLWSQRVSPPEFTWVNRSSCTTPAIYSGVLYFTGWSEQSLEQAQVGMRGVSFDYYKNYVYALNVVSHNKLWNLTFDYSQFSNPLQVSQGIVYTEDYHSLLGFNAQNGALIWNYTIADLWPNSQPTIVDGSVYVGYSDGHLYALRAPSIGFQIGNVDQGTTLYDNPNSIFLLIIVVNLAITVIVLMLFRSKKREEKNN